MTQRYKTIKYSEGKLLLSWHVGNLNGTLREIVLTSSEQPAPEFVKALRAMQKPIEELLGCMIHDTAGDSDLYFDAVVGVRFLEEKETATESVPRGLMVTLAKTIEESDAPFLATTPRLEITAKLKRLVETLERHAERFAVDGIRAQGQLFEAVERGGETLRDAVPEGVTMTLQVAGHDPVTIRGSADRELDQVDRNADDSEWDAAVARGKALTDSAAPPTASASAS